MQCKHRWIVAGALAAAGMAFGTGPASAQEQQRTAAQAQQDRQGDRAGSERAAAVATFPAGIQSKKADEINDVRKTLQTLTEAAFTKDGFNDAVERLVDQDRNRIGANNFADKKFDDLNAKVDQFRQAWKAKYGKDFKIDPNDAFAMTPVIQGEIQDPAAVAGNWPVKATTSSSSDQASDRAVTAGASANKNEDANLEKGRDVAIATFPASHGLPALHVSLLHEAGGWRVDAPNTLSGQQFHDSLLKHMTHVTDMSARWPADVKQAEMAVAHHILAAVYGVDQQAQSSSPSDQQRTPGGGQTATPNR